MNEIEYLYGDTLRWSFGFDNPNKAAVIFACLLPLCWLGWSASWTIRRLCLRISFIIFSGLIVLSAGGCLLMTFSRGGLVAALIALGYVWIQAYRHVVEHWRETLFKPFAWFSMGMIVALIALAIWCGIAKRSTAGVVGDASVSHRALLWKGALQMAHDNPKGFGSGRSGAEYIQWYQSPDRREGYRTMVNSYLTFLVERGWLVFGCCLAVVIAFWRWSLPQGSERYIILSLKASILAFLVAGIFSTTMENGWLWIIPGLCVLGLFMMSREHPCWRFLLLSSAGMTLGILALLWIIGMHEASGDPVVRYFGRQNGQMTVIAVSTRTASSTILLLPDQAVLGNFYGKLARKLAKEANAKVMLEPINPPDLVVAAGKRCLESMSTDTKTKSFLWIAPSIPENAHPPAINASILIPEIDEDGRAEWWKSHFYPGSIITPLPGVGIQIDSVWPDVIEKIKQHLGTKG